MHLDRYLKICALTISYINMLLWSFLLIAYPTFLKLKKNCAIMISDPYIDTKIIVSYQFKVITPILVSKYILQQYI